MANEMPTVKVLGRSRLQGGGQAVSGNARNNKEEVWGELSGTYITAGALFTARDVGLRDFDKISLNPVSVNGGTEPTATTEVTAQFEPTDQKILMQTRDINGASTAAVTTQAYVCNFHAIGDSVRTPEMV